MDLLAADTAMGAVTLRVADLDASTAYYRDGVGLQVLSADGPVVTLGRGTTAVVPGSFTPRFSSTPRRPSRPRCTR
jgi:catechol 2,3-dioxygenase